MKIRVPIIWRSVDKIEDDINQLLNQDSEEEIERSFAIIELDEIESWYGLEDTTILNMKSSKRYEVELPEELFTTLYSKMTLEGIGEIEIKLDTDD